MLLGSNTHDRRSRAAVWVHRQLLSAFVSFKLSAALTSPHLLSLPLCPCQSGRVRSWRTSDRLKSHSSLLSPHLGCSRCCSYSCQNLLTGFQKETMLGKGSSEQNFMFSVPIKQNSLVFSAFSTQHLLISVGSICCVEGSEKANLSGRREQVSGTVMVSPPGSPRCCARLVSPHAGNMAGSKRFVLARCTDEDSGGAVLFLLRAPILHLHVHVPWEQRVMVAQQAYVMHPVILTAVVLKSSLTARNLDFRWVLSLK